MHKSLEHVAKLRVGRGFSPANPPALKGRPTFRNVLLKHDMKNMRA